MPSSQREISLQMLAQLRLLDPSASAEVGTPERMLIDTVAQMIAENQVDLTLLQGQLDFEAKFGENLDRFFALFRFNRQAATFAEGYATFGRLTPATLDIRIPAGTAILAPATASTEDDVPGSAGSIGFVTTFDGYIRAGEIETTIPIRATTAGQAGNVAANRITTFTGDPVLGVTEVTNETALRGGLDIESDDEFKVRFKNTVFRNLAGTQDQYIALALALAFSRKANVVGPLSRYREYVQVPPVADNASYTVNAVVYGIGNGIAGEFSSALSTLPYAQYVWSEVPFFVSNGEFGPGAVFYRPETDFRMNTIPLSKHKGDAYRFFVNIIPAIGADPRTALQPTLTFTNVYTGSNVEVQAIRPGDVLLFEYSYMSAASRNSYENKILNCVDVFVDGENAVIADAIVPRPTSANLFVNNTTSKYHYDNYRRIGEPEHRPVVGNVFTPLFWQPVIELPDQIEVEQTDTTYTFTKGVHYWAVEDVSNIHGTVRARNGIEWAATIPSQVGSDEDDGPFSGFFITEFNVDTSVPVEGYKYDRNIVDLQASVETNKQVTTDALAHRALPRYFKLDISVMYEAGASIQGTNLAIRQAVKDFLASLFFGSVVQLSDLLQIIHNVGGVDNVRWSTDVPNQPATTRLQECDINGRPLANVIVDQVQMASVARALPEVQQIVIAGSPTAGTFKLQYNASTTGAQFYNVSLATLDSALETVTGLTLGTNGAGTPASPFMVTFPGTAERARFTPVEVAFTAGPTFFSSDFILQDDELPALPEVAQPGDSVPGLIIRPRAQHTWVKL